MAQQQPPNQTQEPVPAPPPAPQLPNEPYYQRPQRRPTNRRPLAIALIIVGLIWLLSSALPRLPLFEQIGNRETTIIDRSAAARRLILDAGAADVELARGKQNDIRVEALQRGGAVHDFTVNLQQDGDTLRVSASSSCIVFCNARLRYRIELPAETTVAVQSTSGDINAESLSSGVDIKSASGKITLDAISGPLTISTVSGDVSLRDGQASGANINTTSGAVELQGLSDAIVVKTVSGDITIEEARDGRLTIDTTSGSVRYDGSLANGSENQISSISGDVELRVEQGAGIKLNASSVSGSMQTDFDVDGTTEDHALRGVIGNGAANLTITTTSGDVQIKQR